MDREEQENLQQVLPTGRDKYFFYFRISKRGEYEASFITITHVCLASYG